MAKETMKAPQEDWCLTSQESRQVFQTMCFYLMFLARSNMQMFNKFFNDMYLDRWQIRMIKK